MGITPRYRPEDLNAYAEKFLQKVHALALRRLAYLGELCVNHARENGTYMDRTGNLRSSVGYTVFYNGKPVSAVFKGRADEGVDTGKSYAEEVAKAFPTGYVLVVVAGMKYALHVESTGRDVLTTAEHLAEEKAKEIMGKIKSNIADVYNA